MKQKKVWLCSGLPGSGKSTWVREQIAKNGGVWCSRDKVRFAMVKEDEEYFSKEDEVFNKWIEEIAAALSDPEVENIYIDATHLNDASRNKTLNRLPKETIDKIINVIFATPLETCLERNALRSGRECVPEDTIRQMARRFSMPREHAVIFVNGKD